MIFRLQKSLLIVFLIIAGALLSSCTFTYRHFPFYAMRSLDPVETRLRAAVHASPNLTLISIGTVSYGTFTAPIWLVSYRPDGPVRRTVFVSGGIHGNEPEGVEAVIQDIEALSRDHSCYPDTAIDFAPLVNPWGWTHDERYDRERIDINRTDSQPSPKEANIIRTFWADKKYDLMIDHHVDSRYDGAYLLTYDNPDLARARQAACVLSRLGYGLRSDNGYNGVVGVTREEMPVTKITTLMLYARDRHSEQVYIIETPYAAEEADRVRMSRIVEQSLISGLDMLHSSHESGGGCKDEL